MYFAKFTLPLMRRMQIEPITYGGVTMENSKPEMITVVDQYGCVVSVDFIYRDGDNVTIVR